LLIAFAAKYHKEDCEEDCAHADYVSAAHFLAQNSDTENAGDYRFKTANNADSRHIEEVEAAEGDIYGETSLHTSED
jgi:hypothetical protein